MQIVWISGVGVGLSDSAGDRSFEMAEMMDTEGIIGVKLKFLFEHNSKSSQI